MENAFLKITQEQLSGAVIQNSLKGILQRPHFVLFQFVQAAVFPWKAPRNWFFAKILQIKNTGITFYDYSS